MSLTVMLSDEETDRFTRDYRIQVRLAQLLTSSLSTEMPAGDDIVVAGILWREVLRPITLGTSSWELPTLLERVQSGDLVPPQPATTGLVNPGSTTNGKATDEAGAAASAPSKSGPGRKTGTRSQAKKATAKAKLRKMRHLEEKLAHGYSLTRKAMENKLFKKARAK